MNRKLRMCLEGLNYKDTVSYFVYAMSEYGIELEENKIRSILGNVINEELTEKQAFAISKMLPRLIRELQKRYEISDYLIDQTDEDQLSIRILIKNLVQKVFKDSKSEDDIVDYIFRKIIRNSKNLIPDLMPPVERKYTEDEGKELHHSLSDIPQVKDNKKPIKLNELNIKKPPPILKPSFKRWFEHFYHKKDMSLVDIAHKSGLPVKMLKQYALRVEPKTQSRESFFGKLGQKLRSV
jgi:hypothetical protein